MFVVDYAQLSVHRLMVADAIRTGTYRKALAATIKPGDVVLDAGAGTGIMAMLAVQAGAGKVYAVERSGIVEIARRLVEQNGMGDRIEVIHSDVESVELPEQVDAIVGEWMGCYGVDENLLAPVIVARDRWLKPGGSVLPEAVTAWMAPIEDEDLAAGLAFWHSRPYGLDLGPVAEGSANEVRMGHHDSTADKLLAEPEELWRTDVRAVTVEEARRPLGAQLRFSARRQGRLSALAAWFVARFPDGSTLTNAPDAAETHWGRSVFPLNWPIAVDPGDRIEVGFACEPAGPGYCRQRWSVRVGAGDWEHHDTLRDAAVPGEDG